MKISVALATYNGEKFLKSQLDSLRLQTVIPEEVIIIDDCSTDNTVKIVEEYIKLNSLPWKFYVSKENFGYRRNFYNCLKKCTGDVIFLCDQDDVWYDNKIEEIVKCFEINADCLAVNSSFDAIDLNQCKIESFKRNSRNSANSGIIKFGIDDLVTQKIGLDTVLVYNISPGCTCAFKKEIVDEYLKVSDCEMPHDWELNIIAAKENGLYFLNNALMGYRLHGNNTIGLSQGGDYSLKMNGTDDIRIKMFKVQKAQSDILAIYAEFEGKKTQKFSQYFKKFCNNRIGILYEFKLFPCFKNFFLYPKLRFVATVHFRGLIGDIIYVLKNKLRGGKKSSD